jgi:hypothetical protein
MAIFFHFTYNTSGAGPKFGFQVNFLITRLGKVANSVCGARRKCSLNDRHAILFMAKLGQEGAAVATWASPVTFRLML